MFVFVRKQHAASLFSIVISILMLTYKLHALHVPALVCTEQLHLSLPSVAPSACRPSTPLLGRQLQPLYT